MNARIIYHDTRDVIAQCNIPARIFWGLWLAIIIYGAVADTVRGSWDLFGACITGIGVAMIAGWIAVWHHDANVRRARAARDAEWSRRIAELHATGRIWERQKPRPRSQVINPYSTVPGAPWKIA